MRPGIDLLRFAVATPIIASHLYTLYVILTSGDVATVQERVEISLIIGPIFAVYVAAIVRKISSLATKSWDTTPVHPMFALLAFVIAIVFAIAVPVMLSKFESGEIGTVQDLNTMLGLLETALGLYTGSIIDTLFGLSQARPTGQQQNPASNDGQ